VKEVKPMKDRSGTYTIYLANGSSLSVQIKQDGDKLRSILPSNFGEIFRQEYEDFLIELEKDDGESEDGGEQSD
jgi:hypothetical protein